MKKANKLTAAVLSVFTLVTCCHQAVYSKAVTDPEITAIINSGSTELINVSIKLKKHDYDDHERQYCIKEAMDYCEEVIYGRCGFSEDKVRMLMTKLAYSVEGNPDSYMQIFMDYYNQTDSKSPAFLACHLRFDLENFSKNEYYKERAEKIIAEENLDPSVKCHAGTQSINGKLTCDEIMRISERDDIESVKYVPEQDLTAPATTYSVIATIGKNENIINGDLNGDKKVNVADLVLMQLTISNDKTYSQAADMNNDGTIDVFDMILLKRVILGV